jgi:hypothetical protein
MENVAVYLKNMISIFLVNGRAGLWKFVARRYPGMLIKKDMTLNCAHFQQSGLLSLFINRLVRSWEFFS